MNSPGTILYLWKRIPDPVTYADGPGALLDAAVEQTGQDHVCRQPPGCLDL